MLTHGRQGDGTDYSYPWKNGSLCDAWPVPQAIRPSPLGD